MNMEQNAEAQEDQIERLEIIGSDGGELVLLAREALALQEGASAPCRLIEIGCGDGSRLEALAEIGQVVGIEKSPALAERAQKAHPGFDVRVADPCALPFEEEFDLAFSSGVFHATSDQVTLLKSVAATLVGGGMLVAEMGAAGNLARIEEGYTQAMRAHSGDYTCQFCFPREPSYRRLLGIAGLEVERMEVIERDMPLPGGRAGLRLFAERLFSKGLALYRPEDRASILAAFEANCEEDLWDEQQGCWVADCRLLRFIARKTRRVGRAQGGSPLSILGS